MTTVFGNKAAGRTRQVEIAAYIRGLRRINHGRDYSEPEVMRVMSDMHHPAFPF